MTRADEVRRLAEALVQSSAFNRKYAESIAGDLYDAGARMPEPPAQSNPVSRETAEKSIIARCGTIHGFSPETIERERRFLLATAPALVADLAEAAKGPHGRIKLVDEWCGSHWFHPAALVAALTRADAGGA